MLDELVPAESAGMRPVMGWVIHEKELAGAPIVRVGTVSTALRRASNFRACAWLAPVFRNDA
jgi:hypothetical protein